MEKFFNTAGPTIEADHYHIPPLERVDWPEIQALIGQKRYFLLHAPRQTGKTSTLLAMMRFLNIEGRYACAYANIESAQAARNDVDSGVDTICSTMSSQIDLYLKTRLQEWYFASGRQMAAKDRLFGLLSHWAATSTLPTVLFIDEVDALVGDTLVSLLRQIRTGYAQRPQAFPQAMILCGVRDIQDYRIQMANQEIITGGSAFNIKSESLRMGNFTADECQRLFMQHTLATGQRFDESIFPLMWRDTAGQPWLVNALGYELTWKNHELRDRNRMITPDHYQQAREDLILSRATHLDQLVDKLREPRVHSVIGAILSGDERSGGLSPGDLTYVYDLGLIRLKPSLTIANDIYKEVIPRELIWTTQVTITNQETAWYVRADGRLDMSKLLEAFQRFFRENADAWIERFDYKEAGPQLLLQAFLQRIVNGGGRIGREYALGRRRTDLFIEWPTSQAGFFGVVQRVVLEAKILRGALETVLSEGLTQTADYAATVGADESHLIVFDRQSIDWDAKIWHRVQDGIGIWGC